MVAKKALRCVFTFIIGIGIVAVFFFWLAYLDFFGVGASTFKSFAVFCIFYGSLGVIAGLLWPGGSWVHGLFLGIPMFIMLGPLNFGDPSPLEQLPRMVAALSPFSACLGAYIGERLALRRKKVTNIN